MWALVEDNAIIKIINNPKAMVINDVRHSRNIFSFRCTNKEREDIGIVPPNFILDHVLNDSKNVINGFPFSGDDSCALFLDFHNFYYLNTEKFCYLMC